MKKTNFKPISGQKKIWLSLNIFFIISYSIYLLSWIIILPFVKEIPRSFYNMILVLSHTSSLDFKNLKLSNCYENPTLMLAIFFSTSPGLLFLLPFYLLSIVNTVSALLKMNVKNNYFYKIESLKPRLVFYAYFLEYIFAPLIILGLLTGHAQLAGAIVYLYMLKTCFQKDKVFKDALDFFLNFVESKIHFLPPKHQKLYENFRSKFGPSKMVLVKNK